MEHNRGEQRMNMSQESPIAVKRPCPVCGGERGRPLFRQQFAAMSSGNLMPAYNVVVCDDCGLAYADGIPPSETFAAYYRDMSKYEYQDREGRESEFDLARFRRFAEAIRQAAPSRDTRVLDVGCSTGRLLALLKESGYTDVLGLDPSPVCAQAALRCYGVPVVTGSLADLAMPASRFDLIVFSGVLEHLVEPRSAIGKAGRLLSAGGAVAISVPDATQFASCDDAPFQQFSTEHINFFSPTSLANLMASCGFACDSIWQTTYEVERGQTSPVVEGVFRKQEGASSTSTIRRGDDTEATLRAYIARSQAVDEQIRRTIAAAIDSSRPLIVWGVGTHTLRLLATSRLAEAKVVAFVDSNPRYQGKELRGVPILAPADLRSRSEPILISSRVFQVAIERQIRDVLQLKNELYLLYDI